MMQRLLSPMANCIKLVGSCTTPYNRTPELEVTSHLEVTSDLEVTSGGDLEFTAHLEYTTDLKLLAHLHDYLGLLRRKCLHVSGSYFVDQSQYHLDRLISTLSTVRTKKQNNTASLIGYFRNVLLITLETLRMSVTYALCTCACKKFSSKFKESIPLDRVTAHMTDIQDRVLKLLTFLQDLFDAGNCTNLKRQCEFGAYLTEAMDLQALLQDCDMMLTTCEEAVRGKAKSESRFFGALSLSVGAMCLGRLAYAVYQNEGSDQLIQAGLWAACSGLTAGVLQIPRWEAKQLLQQLDYHRGEYLTMITMTTPWFNSPSEQNYKLSGMSSTGNLSSFTQFKRDLNENHKLYVLQNQVDKVFTREL